MKILLLLLFLLELSYHIAYFVSNNQFCVVRKYSTITFEKGRKEIIAKLKQEIKKVPKNDKDWERAPGVYSNKRPIHQGKLRKIFERRRSARHRVIFKTPQRNRNFRKRTIEKHRRFQGLADDMTYVRKEHDDLPVLEKDTDIPLVETICEAADKRKTNYMHVMRVGKWTEITNFMIVFEGNSKPQNQAICMAIEVISPRLAYVLLCFSI
jgi:hypothetical protein